MFFQLKMSNISMQLLAIHIHQVGFLKYNLCSVFTTLQSGVALPSWPRLGSSPLERPSLERQSVLVYPELERFPEHVSFIVKTRKALGKPGRVGHKVIPKIFTCCDTGILVGRKRPLEYYWWNKNKAGAKLGQGPPIFVSGLAGEVHFALPLWHSP